MMYKSKKLNENICSAVNFIYQARETGLLNKDGSVPDHFIQNFIELCEIKYEKTEGEGLRIAQEAFAQYDRNRMGKASFFKEKAPSCTEEKPPSKFSILRGTESCNFGRLLYKFVSNKKTFI